MSKIATDTSDPFEGRRLCRRCFQDALLESDFCLYHKTKIENQIQRDSNRRERREHWRRRRGSGS